MGANRPGPTESVVWEHGAVEDVSRRRYQKTFNDVDRKALEWNLAAATGLGIAWAMGYLKCVLRDFQFGDQNTKLHTSKAAEWVEDNLPSARGEWVDWFFIACALIFAVNISRCLYKLVRPAPTFADYALTPSQRRKLGLDPNGNSVESGKPSKLHG
ncbi:hypothetical protein HDV00_000776 [Rhizophlyctis rosea]|nr:hypothetical protein HDV00_000776 [Rhizophlyctis rosea]